jgi:hypothetical protein
MPATVHSLKQSAADQRIADYKARKRAAYLELFGEDVDRMAGRSYYHLCDGGVASNGSITNEWLGPKMLRLWDGPHHFEWKREDASHKWNPVCSSDGNFMRTSESLFVIVPL